MKRIYTNLLLTTASIAVLLILFEIFLALYFPSKMVDQPIYEEYHPLFGWANKPGTEGDVYYAGGKYFRRRHNSRGLRSSREISYEKPAGVRRVMLLGDSFLWGYGVNDEDVVSEALQKLLGADFEIINGAVRGYGTDQELLWLKEEGLKYKPDIVILGFFAGNDWDDISNSVRYGYPKPYYSLNGRLLTLHNVPVPDTRETRKEIFEKPKSSFGRLKKFLRHHTHAYPFIMRRLNSMPGLRKFFLSVGLADEFTGELQGIRAITIEKEAIQPLFEAIIIEMNKIAESNEAQLLLFFIPEKENTPGAPFIYKGARGISRNRNEAASSYMSELAQALNVSYLNLLPEIRERQSRGEILYFPGTDDHHWTPAGHRMAAGALYEWLNFNGL
ncbi:MAG: SGNH/GDSL hydrolase family protein, partial [Nitrospirae bacterium]|nr:SGNH/GDSL hydrolase family protein [Nitrospirota bacterium]